jgi:hypothetical protein
VIILTSVTILPRRETLPVGHSVARLASESAARTAARRAFTLECMSGQEDHHSAEPARGRRGYWLPGAIAMTVLVIIAVAVGAGDLDHGAPKTLHGADVASEIALGIQAQEAASKAPAVTCPDTEPVRSGLRFECSLVAAGRSVSVDVVEIDGRGQLRWQLGVGRP